MESLCSREFLLGLGRAAQSATQEMATYRRKLTTSETSQVTKAQSK
jgi:hypothetical protein